MYYSVSNSEPTTFVQVWNGSKWEMLWDLCKVISPNIIEDPEGNFWEIINIEDTPQYEVVRDYPRDFWEGQPVILKRPRQGNLPSYNEGDIVMETTDYSSDAIRTIMAYEGCSEEKAIDILNGKYPDKLPF